MAFIKSTKRTEIAFKPKHPHGCSRRSPPGSDDGRRERKNLMTITNEKLKEAYAGSYYTITGAGGDLQEWKDGYASMMREQGIGTITKWIDFTGKDMNDEFNLTGDNRYPDDLRFLAFPLTGLNVGKLAIFKLRMRDRWFDDIVDNNARRENKSVHRDSPER